MHFGALPGTISVLSVGPEFCYAAVFNSGEQNFATVHQAVVEFMNDQISIRNEWPETDLFP